MTKRLLVSARHTHLPKSHPTQRMIVMNRCLGFMSIAVAFAIGAAAQAEDLATLTGHFVVDGAVAAPKPIKADKDPDVCGKHNLHEEGLEVAGDGSLHDAIIYLRTEGVAPAASYKDSEKEEVVLDNKNCRFEPHVVLLRTTQTLVLKNSDPVGHNSKVDPIKNAAINPIIPSSQEVKQAFPQEENLPIKVGCNIHPWIERSAAGAQESIHGRLR